MVFEGTCYITPLLGAYLADSHLSLPPPPHNYEAPLISAWQQLGETLCPPAPLHPSPAPPAIHLCNATHTNTRRPPPLHTPGDGV